MRRRVLHFCIALDQLLFVVITLGKSYPTKTIAAWSFENAKTNNVIARMLKTVIDFVYKPLRDDHCLDSYLEQNRFNEK